MRKSLLFLLFVGCFVQPLFSQNPDWRDKIDSKLWEEAVKPDSAVEFLIIMQKQADVKAAANQLRTKAEKGRYVFETLSAFAENDQRTVRDVLQNEGVPMHSFWIINGLWAKGNRATLEQIAKLQEVGALRLNPIWHLSRAPGFDGEVPVAERNQIPWGLSKINADDVWNQGIKGEGIVVGGQDTGYEWEHPDIKDKYRGWDGVNADHDYNWHDAIRVLLNGDPLPVNSCGLDEPAPCDDHDHGTHTMGTMVGTEGAENIGVAPDAKWMGCRNMEEGDGTPATYIECFEWFVAPTDLDDANPDPNMAPHVINNSWGCPESEGCNNSNYSDMEDVVENVKAAGIVVVVSAGNSGAGCSTVNTPAAIYDASFSVGATDVGENIAGFSSRGPVTVYTNIMKPDISAPGVGVRSCIGHDNNPDTYGHASWNGTSMAGPHVAGVAALIMCARPDLIGHVDDVENLMRDNAVVRFAVAPFCGTDNGSSHPNNVYGWGRVDALAAVNAALPVELLEFKAIIAGKTAQIDWITGAENDCAHFMVQRSSDGLNWKNIGELPCRGNDQTGETPYEFLDVNPLKGLNYYRLEQFDYSGKSNIGPVRALSFSSSGYSLRLTSGQGLAFFEIVGEDADEQLWRLEIRAADGSEVQTLSVTERGWLKLPDYPPGVYTVLLRNANGQALAVEKWLWMR